MSKYIKISSLTKAWVPAFTKLSEDSVPDEVGIDLMIEEMIGKQFFVAQVGTAVRVHSLQDVQITIVQREDDSVPSEDIRFI